MTGYDRKTLHVSHDSDEPLEISVEVDVSGDGEWHVYDSLSVPAGEQISYEFADSFSAYWVRLRSSHDATVTGQFEYR
jgi:hypothetical protein